jgi:16S rRNA (adenine1518-N6/adenine1519-N6)-dimethyltransferase
MNSLPRAKKSLGQHFLHDTNIILRIINELSPQRDETIIEIGPGRGALTTHLIEKVKRLTVIEFDRDLVPLLKERFGIYDHFTLIEDDVLKVNLSLLIPPNKRARLVANLPYNISTAILQRLIKERQSIPEMIVMLQREVVDRISAPPASSERGFLSVLIQAYYDVEHLFDVAPGSFSPPPKVWSSVIKLSSNCSIPSAVDEDLLWDLVSAGFAQRRKTIMNNLRSAPQHLKERIQMVGTVYQLLDQAKIDANRRAETLTLEEWFSLALNLG